MSSCKFVLSAQTLALSLASVLDNSIILGGDPSAGAKMSSSPLPHCSSGVGLILSFDESVVLATASSSKSAFMSFSTQSATSPSSMVVVVSVDVRHFSFTDGAFETWLVGGELCCF